MRRTTIHFRLLAMEASAREAKQMVREMRRLALALPFEEVGEVVELRGPKCAAEARRADLRDEGLMFDVGLYVQYDPEKIDSAGRIVYPDHAVAFSVAPGPGSESARFGLCRYPAAIIWRGRKVPTRLSGWHWRSFCKTQYASDPACGGVPNFLRCHISVVTLLDRAAKLPGLKVCVKDEGKYGPSTYAEDWQSEKPHYRRHRGRYSPAALAKEVGAWNALTAGFVDALGDALSGSGITLASLIKDCADFERLEFKGRSKRYLDPFLQAVKELAVKVRFAVDATASSKDCSP